MLFYFPLNLASKEESKALELRRQNALTSILRFSLPFGSFISKILEASVSVNMNRVKIFFLVLSCESVISCFQGSGFQQGAKTHRRTAYIFIFCCFKKCFNFNILGGGS